MSEEMAVAKPEGRISKFFHLRERGGNYRSEIIGGIVTFLAMSTYSRSTPPS